VPPKKKSEAPPIPPEMLLETWAENPMQPDGTPVPGSLVDLLYPKSDGWNPGTMPYKEPPAQADLLKTWAENPMQPSGTGSGTQVPVPGSPLDLLYPKSAGWNPGSQSAPQPEQYQPPRNLVAELWARYKSLQAKRKV
jgi:hypothetical protein